MSAALTKIRSQRIFGYKYCRPDLIRDQLIAARAAFEIKGLFRNEHYNHSTLGADHCHRRLYRYRHDFFATPGSGPVNPSTMGSDAIAAARRWGSRLSALWRWRKTGEGRRRPSAGLVASSHHP